jgi:hypothetical protein
MLQVNDRSRKVRQWWFDEALRKRFDVYGDRTLRLGSRLAVVYDISQDIFGRERRLVDNSAVCTVVGPNFFYPAGIAIPSGRSWMVRGVSVSSSAVGSIEFTAIILRYSQLSGIGARVLASRTPAAVGTFCPAISVRLPIGELIVDAGVDVTNRSSVGYFVSQAAGNETVVLQVWGHDVTGMDLKGVDFSV